VRFQHQR